MDVYSVQIEIEARDVDGLHGGSPMLLRRDDGSLRGVMVSINGLALSGSDPAALTRLGEMLVAAGRELDRAIAESEAGRG